MKLDFLNENLFWVVQDFDEVSVNKWRFYRGSTDLSAPEQSLVHAIAAEVGGFAISLPTRTLYYTVNSELYSIYLYSVKLLGQNEATLVRAGAYQGKFKQLVMSPYATCGRPESFCKYCQEQGCVECVEGATLGVEGLCIPPANCGPLDVENADGIIYTHGDFGEYYVGTVACVSCKVV